MSYHEEMKWAFHTVDWNDTLFFITHNEIKKIYVIYMYIVGNLHTYTGTCIYQYSLRIKVKAIINYLSNEFLDKTSFCRFPS